MTRKQLDRGVWSSEKVWATEMNLAESSIKSIKTPAESVLKVIKQVNVSKSRDKGTREPGTTHG